MIKRVYVDTSVVGGKFDKEFTLLTTPFWNAVFNRKMTIIVSDILEKELEGAPIQIYEFFTQLPESQIEHVVSTDESDNLAKKYIAEYVVGRSSENDCKHIALATINHADCLVSWNFKHIVNINRIRGYNGVNMLLAIQP
ncbi:MAG: hypothetical protein LBF88_06510 [Planctomycetaceae bacterium]|jgi:predicted nucleic acid-binding protein|nr:hypothetical protein [Planctomycetaceae bacterium]